MIIAYQKDEQKDKYSVAYVTMNPGNTSETFQKLQDGSFAVVYQACNGECEFDNESKNIFDRIMFVYQDSEDLTPRVTLSGNGVMLEGINVNKNFDVVNKEVQWFFDNGGFEKLACDCVIKSIEYRACSDSGKVVR